MPRADRHIGEPAAAFVVEEPSAVGGGHEHVVAAVVVVVRDSRTEPVQTGLVETAAGQAVPEGAVLLVADRPWRVRLVDFQSRPLTNSRSGQLSRIHVEDRYPAPEELGIPLRASRAIVVREGNSGQSS